jgi:hypothetical protein
VISDGNERAETFGSLLQRISLVPLRGQVEQRIASASDSAWHCGRATTARSEMHGTPFTSPTRAPASRNSEGVISRQRLVSGLRWWCPVSKPCPSRGRTGSERQPTGQEAPGPRRAWTWRQPSLSTNARTACTNTMLFLSISALFKSTNSDKTTVVIGVDGRLGMKTP